jgi:hypothetical protein
LLKPNFTAAASFLNTGQKKQPLKHLNGGVARLVAAVVAVLFLNRNTKNWTIAKTYIPVMRCANKGE